MIAKMQTVMLDPAERVEVYTAGPAGAVVTIEAHEDGRVWVVQPAPEDASLFDVGYLLPLAGYKLRLSLGNGQSVFVLGDPNCGAVSTVSVLVEVPNA